MTKANQWTSLNLSPEEEAAWGEAGFSPKEAREWMAAYFDLEEAIDLRDVGFTPASAAACEIL